MAELIKFQPFLRFWVRGSVGVASGPVSFMFQPFLRFWGLGSG